VLKVDGPDNFEIFSEPKQAADASMQH